MEADREQNTTIIVPSGKELKSIRVYCSKHGDVTDACIGIQTVMQEKTGKKTVQPNIYCIECLNEMLSKFQEDGLIGKIALVPVVQDSNKNEDKSITVQ